MVANRMFSLLSGLLSLVLTVASLFVGAAIASPPHGFVTTKGSSFELDGKPFVSFSRFVLRLHA